MPRRLHKDEISVDASLVRRLVDTQFAEYADLPLHRLVASGSTNILFRLGDDLLIRLPRQPGGGSGILKERRWAPAVSRYLPVAVPEMAAPGKPAEGYPEPWAIVRWLDGGLPRCCAPDDSSTSERRALAVDLADVVLALRAAPVPEAALSDPTLRWYRGRPLAEFDRPTRYNIRQCHQIENLDLDLNAALALWTDALRLPGAREVAPDRWYHSDLVAENLLLRDGRLSAVLDFGGLAVGDPTIDLHGAWEVLDPGSRQVFRNRLGVDDAEWMRGRAWALAIALGCFAYYWHTMPGRCNDRLAMARAVLADPG